MSFPLVSWNLSPPALVRKDLSSIFLDSSPPVEDVTTPHEIYPSTIYSIGSGSPSWQSLVDGFAWQTTESNPFLLNIWPPFPQETKAPLPSAYRPSWCTQPKAASESYYDFEEFSNDDFDEYFNKINGFVTNKEETSGIPAHHLTYRDEIIAHMTEMDIATLPSKASIDTQPEVYWCDRPGLVDYLIQNHADSGFRPEALYLAINIMDRHMSRTIVRKIHHQLLSLTVLWIAMKSEGFRAWVPTVSELARICVEGYYTEADFVKMEGHVLRTIDWTVGHPTAEAWLRVHSEASGGSITYKKAVVDTARYIMEITLHHRRWVGIQSSVLAAGALLLASFIHHGVSLGPYEDVNENSKRQAALQVAGSLDRFLAEKQHLLSITVIKKFEKAELSCASTTCSEWYASGRRFSYRKTWDESEY